jgi:hypothetical protein
MPPDPECQVFTGARIGRPCYKLQGKLCWRPTRELANQTLTLDIHAGVELQFEAEALKQPASPHPVNSIEIGS